MPITIKDYSWDETDESVHVVVPLKGVKANKVDIFSTDEYLKVNFPPYLFEVVLFKPVDDSKSTAQVGNGTVTFTLHKKEPGLWNRLISLHSDDKEVMKSKRQAAIDAAHKKAQEDTQRRLEEKRERDRMALKEQMRLENEERQRVEDLKEAERQKATEDIERWKLEQLAAEQDQIKIEKFRDLEESTDRLTGFQKATEDIERWKLEQLAAEQDQIKIEKVRDLEESTDRLTDEADIFYKENSVEDSVPVVDKRLSGQEDTPQSEIPTQPPPRSSGSIQVTFTPRVFPTPLRESNIQAEEEWLKKQAEAGRIAEIDDPDLTEEEKNPVYLKDKGDAFFKSGNYLAAVNAYNLAIRLNSKIHAVYSNRATCHLKLRNFIKCIEDCSKALDLLTPPVDANAKSRLRAHVKRGTAFCELELYIEGLQDYEAALKVDPTNTQLIADADRIRTVIQSTVD